MFVVPSGGDKDSPFVEFKHYEEVASASTFSFSADCGAHTERHLVIVIAYRSSSTSGDEPTGVTADGTSMTLLGSAKYTPNADGIAVYTGSVNTSGSITIAGTFNAANTTASIAVYSLYGLASTTPVNAQYLVVTEAPSSPLTWTDSLRAGDIVLCALNNNLSSTGLIINGASNTPYGFVKDIDYLSDRVIYSAKIKTTASGAALTAPYNTAYVPYAVWLRWR